MPEPTARMEEPTAAEKAAAFGDYLEEMGLPVGKILGNLGPAEVGDVISFFYAGMPDRFKGASTDRPGPGGHPEPPVPAELWCAALWEADTAHRSIA